ncbi:FtsP/CotA-like multicopper oxidase with cupredoxin domain [Bradyrhizobium sp. AZCC 1610]|uniref:multicopper oxidase family protein n=1 Tax=Bradyrhizobium sp. AZCC 1610 TaxID=3117020 RepID=UPI002FF07115
MVRTGPMASLSATVNRRTLLAGFGAAALAPVWPVAGRAQGRPALALQAKADALALRDGPPTPLWSLQGPELRFQRGDTVEIAFANELPVPAVLNWRGIDGVAAAEPLTARAPLAAGGKLALQLPLRHAGTFLCDMSLLGDGQALPSRARALVVRESDTIAVDRDEVFLVEDWQILPDGTAIVPGVEPKDAMPAYTVNGKTSFDISARTNERIRLRFISACQRAVIATKIENYEVRVMAVDGQPAEPFQARNGALVLAPGGRADVFIDVTMPAGTSTPILLHDGKEARPVGKIIVSGEPPIRPAPLRPAPPLPSNGLPERIELKGATRVDLALGGPQGDWVTPANFAATTAPAFRVKTGRTVVLALTNRAATATVFHLHGHHFRLLDRLDDGWKPFWLDTLAIEPGQTQRIAFLAEHPGRYLIESVATDWAAPRLVRWYAVE